MKISRSNQNLARLWGTVPDAVIDLLAEINEEDRADFFSTVAILEGPADLRTPIIVSDKVTTIDFGTPLCDAEGAPRILAAAWEVASEPTPVGPSSTKSSVTGAAVPSSSTTRPCGSLKTLGPEIVSVLAETRTTEDS